MHDDEGGPGGSQAQRAAASVSKRATKEPNTNGLSRGTPVGILRTDFDRVSADGVAVAKKSVRFNGLSQEAVGVASDLGPETEVTQQMLDTAPAPRCDEVETDSCSLNENDSHNAGAGSINAKGNVGALSDAHMSASRRPVLKSRGSSLVPVGEAQSSNGSSSSVLLTSYVRSDAANSRATSSQSNNSRNTGSSSKPNGRKRHTCNVGGISSTTSPNDKNCSSSFSLPAVTRTRGRSPGSEPGRSPGSGPFTCETEPFSVAPPSRYRDKEHPTNSRATQYDISMASSGTSTASKSSNSCSSTTTSNSNASRASRATSAKSAVPKVAASSTHLSFEDDVNPHLSFSGTTGSMPGIHDVSISRHKSAHGSNIQLPPGISLHNRSNVKDGIVGAGDSPTLRGGRSERLRSLSLSPTFNASGTGNVFPF